jgi:hypothetical protein
MENFEDFKKRNVGFDEGRWYGMDEYFDKTMRKCYDVALKVEQTYNELHPNINEPQILDIVEFADDFEVYKRGMICENLYGKSEFGMLCICERGCSHTDGKYFSTGGGAFRHIHKSKLRYAGETENVVWTWGCYGSGAHQGIYFPLKVRKWIIPYETPKFGSKVYIRGKNAKDCYGRDLDAVWIENFGSCFGHAASFNSIKAFKAWAEYVGYNSYAFDGTFERRSQQKIQHRCIVKMEDLPENAKPMKVIANGRVHDGWVVNDGITITELWLNAYDPNEVRPKYGTKEWDDEIKLFHKYCRNPMGV